MYFSFVVEVEEAVATRTRAQVAKGFSPSRIVRLKGISHLSAGSHPVPV